MRQLKNIPTEATRIVNEAYKSAESKKREALVEAKEEILKAKNEHENGRRRSAGWPGR